MKLITTTAILATMLAVLPSCQKKAAGSASLLNVSYDPTREFYVEFNDAVK